MQVIEKFILSKHGDEERSEDAIFTGESFCAVIDGATNKTDFEIEGKSPGYIASQLVRMELGNLPPKIDAEGAVAQINSAIRLYLLDHDLLEQLRQAPELRTTASVAIYSRHYDQIWMVGDCQCAVDGNIYQNTKKIDAVLGEIRAFILQCELLSGSTVEELRQHDVGREYIVPLLKRQYEFQNHDVDSEFAYAAIDGFGKPERNIRIVKVGRQCQSVVLASDGYPVLKPTLNESENILHAILLEDPLLISVYKSTKGLTEGLVSFDDRSYLRLKPANQSIQSTRWPA